MKAINVDVLGVGAWGPSFRSWPDLLTMLNGGEIEDDGAKGPKPEVIPANERRRAPLPVRLAVESSWQATQHAGIEPTELPCVFVSSIGDTQLTDYMCRALASDNKALSPTKFHNSVHNAAAGYWTISTGCMQAANSIAGFEESVSLTLMEALLQSQIEQRPILLTFYDAPSSEMLKPMLKNESSLAVSIIISPTGLIQDKNVLCSLTASTQNQSSEWSDFAGNDVLKECYETNLSAKIFPLLKMIGLNDQQVLNMPLSPESSLTISLASK